MKRRHFIQFVAAGVALAGCRKKPLQPALPPGSAVLAFGDSVTYGTGAGRGEDWPTLLAGRTGWQIANAGIPGDTAEAAKQRLPAALETYRPALVIIELGGNDFLRRRPTSAVKEDLRQMIGMVRQASAQAVLVAVPEFSLLGVVARRPADSPIYRTLGDEERVPVVADVFSDILARPELCADQIHPNALGYQEMAAGIHAALREIGLAGAV